MEIKGQNYGWFVKTRTMGMNPPTIFQYITPFALKITCHSNIVRINLIFQIWNDFFCGALAKKWLFWFWRKVVKSQTTVIAIIWVALACRRIGWFWVSNYLFLAFYEVKFIECLKLRMHNIFIICIYLISVWISNWTKFLLKKHILNN